MWCVVVFRNSCLMRSGIELSQFLRILGWSGGAMVLSKLPVPGRPANFDESGARSCPSL